jgi:crotonobetaine/carnitine-CoA ligase
MSTLAELTPFEQSPVYGRDLPSMLGHWVQQCPDKCFLVYAPDVESTRRWTYAEFDHEARRLAAGMAAQGIQKGDRVLLHMDNSPEFLFTWFACAVIGAVAVTTNTRCAAAEVAYFVEKSESVAAITQPSLLPMILDIGDKLRFVACSDNNCGEKTERETHDKLLPLEQLFLEEPLQSTGVHDATLDCSIQFTSGTTSKPKAVVWTHGNVVWGAQTTASNFRLQHDDVCHSFLPLFHTNNQSYSLLGSLWVGGTYVVQPKFSASQFWPVALDNRCTWACMIPFCVKALFEQPVPEHSFRFWSPAVSIPLAAEHFKLNIFGLYGMTETITQPICGDPQRPGPDMCIGRAVPGYTLSVRNETGDEVAVGETGDLFIKGVRGMSLFKEYLHDSAATEKSFDAEGWFDTGDRVRMDEEGNLFFADRNKDMLKVGGENVAASEIELLMIQSGLASEAAVIGKPHDMLDEVPVAFVIPNPGLGEDVAQKLIDLCAENLADFKVPRAVYIVEDLPRSLLNKISKKDLRDKLAEME